ncbi:protein still life, isoform SIF type 1-like, partial [Lucilia cuprina]|uniref:protein still life, isoform SIF type 1-like n=1 Tax=Lucilia cuprina TaxID=7375 RepID=UPI001F0711C1
FAKTKYLGLIHHSSFRLWAEVFHVSASGAGTVKWQQVSEDLVPVNISCIQDSPECVFHITAYNSQVDKILDVRLVQPGTRIGQASECFVYWKDPMTNDTWGLNFTSPIDAKQFRECCVSIPQTVKQSQPGILYFIIIIKIFINLHKRSLSTTS